MPYLEPGRLGTLGNHMPRSCLGRWEVEFREIEVSCARYSPTHMHTLTAANQFFMWVWVGTVYACMCCTRHPRASFCLRFPVVQADPKRIHRLALHPISRRGRDFVFVPGLAALVPGTLPNTHTCTHTPLLLPPVPDRLHPVQRQKPWRADWCRCRVSVGRPAAARIARAALPSLRVLVTAAVTGRTHGRGRTARVAARQRTNQQQQQMGGGGRGFIFGPCLPFRGLPCVTD